VRGERAILLALTLSCTACAPALMKLPLAPGTQPVDATTALDAATRACRNLSTITAEIGVSGSVGGRGLRARMTAGLAAPASARLEAVAPFGQPIFIFVARDSDATLLLPGDRRVVEHGRPADVLDAVAGVPLDAAALRVTLSGCAEAARAQDARQAGDNWRIVPADAGTLFLQRESSSAPWRLVAAEHRAASGSWRAEYRDFRVSEPAAGLPQAVRLASLDGKRFDLRLALSQLEINTTLGADAFTVQIPAGTEPITIDELRRSGPLASSSSNAK